MCTTPIHIYQLRLCTIYKLRECAIPPPILLRYRKVQCKCTVQSPLRGSQVLATWPNDNSIIGQSYVFPTSANIPFDRFGWFYDRNGSESYDGLFEMFTGEDDIYKVSLFSISLNYCPPYLQVGQISRWNEEGSLGNLYPQPCDRLEGSAGEFFPQDQVQNA